MFDKSDSSILIKITIPEYPRQDEINLRIECQPLDSEPLKSEDKSQIVKENCTSDDDFKLCKCRNLFTGIYYDIKLITWKKNFESVTVNLNDPFLTGNII